MQIQAGALKKLDNGPELLPIALHYLGLPHHSQNLEDYKKAEALLLEMRKKVRYFHSSKYVGDLANGDICMAVGFSGDIMQAGNRAADSLVDSKLEANATVYPPQDAMDNLYALEAMPLEIDRVRTRIWRKANSGI